MSDFDHDLAIVGFDLILAVFNVVCSWTCNILGASASLCSCRNPNLGHYLLRLWIDKFDVRLSLALRFSTMLRPLQCWNFPQSHLWWFPTAQVHYSHAYVSPYFRRCSWNIRALQLPSYFERSHSLVISNLFFCRYHSLHHTDLKTNFCLSMPLFDELWKTTNDKSWDLQREISSRTGELSLFFQKIFSLQMLTLTEMEKISESKVADFVFLAHVVDVMSAMHSPFVFRSFSSTPFSIKPFLFPMWPFTYLVMLFMWAKAKTFLFSLYYLRGKLHETWVVPRFGFQVWIRQSTTWKHELCFSYA